MTMAELAKRVSDLEKELTDVKKKLERVPEALPWWMTGTGSFANDPGFDEIVKLGRQYRDSLHPDRKKKSKKPKQ
jgi:hypothetical protein